MESFLKDLNLISEWYEKVIYEMPIIFMVLTSIAEIYVLFLSGRSIYSLTVGIYYGYLSFLVLVFGYYVRSNLSELDIRKDYNCLDKHWMVIVPMFVSLCDKLIREITL